MTGLDLTVIGNCQIAGLLDARARLVWMCLPRPDGDPMFGALLTQRGGAADNSVCAFDLDEVTASEQHYVRNTAIVETIVDDAHGARIRITDYCPRFRARGRMFRPMMWCRLIEPLNGRPVLRCRLRPTLRYGQAPLAGRGGSHHVAFDGAAVRFRVTTDLPVMALMNGSPYPLDRPAAFVLGPDETLEDAPLVLARSMLEETRAYWIDWVRTLAIPFEWQEAVIRAAITLKLCTYEDTGAVLAALTTSIPESPNSGRNWDYRYCWLRDSYFVIRALNRLGATRTMEGYLQFMDRLISSTPIDALQPVYGLSGESELAERVVTDFEGYAAMGPVRVGNAAAAQRQHDVYGSLILAITQLFFDTRLVRPGDVQLFRRLEQLGRRAAAEYQLPDAGPWEYRGSARVHTYSAAMSWAGCDRLARIAARLQLADENTRWRTLADSMREEILRRAWSNARQTLVGAWDTEELDATVLLLPELGLLSAHDPRFRATVSTLGAELRDGSLLYRYRHRDDFGYPDTAFTVCGFWYADALAATGQRDAARNHFDALLRYRNATGLLSEDIDPRSGVQWGNFPQTYSMVGLINTALRLSEDWEAVL